MTNHLRFQEEPFAFTYKKRDDSNERIKGVLELEPELEDFEFEQSIKSTPALLGKLEKSSHGETIYVKIGIGNGLPATTGIYIPNYFKLNSEFTVLIYLHGHKTHYPGNNVLINEYWNGARFPFFALREEVAASGKSVILVAPSLGTKSQAGTLIKRGGFDAFLDQVLSGLNEHFIAPKYGNRISGLKNIILAAHSGGGSPMWKIAAGKDLSTTKIKECWCFDGMYGRVANAWTVWAKSHRQKGLHVYYGLTKGKLDPKTGIKRFLPRDNAEAIAYEAKKQGLKNICVQPSRAKTIGKVSAHYWVPKVHIKERLLNLPCPVKQDHPQAQSFANASPTQNMQQSPSELVSDSLLQIQHALASGQWYLGLGMALVLGLRDENKLTSMIFYARHPERGGRKLEKNERDFKKLSQEWLDIRNKIVRPFLAKNAPVTPSGTQLKAPVPGNSPHPEVNIAMPKSGSGFYSYTNPNHRYGRVETIRALKSIALGWQMAHPRGPRIGIGDISLLGGGLTPRHKSHQTGLDVDLRLMRNDGRELGARYQDSFYSRALTQDLVNRIIKNGILKVQYIFFNDPYVSSVRFWKGHDNHLHVRFYPPEN